MPIGAIHFGPGRVPPEAEITGTRHQIAGITPSGWLSIAGVGWRRLAGTADGIVRVSQACTLAHDGFYRPYERLKVALHRHIFRPQGGLCAGLPRIPIGGGEFAIRIADIADPTIRTAFAAFLEGFGPDMDLLLPGNIELMKVPEGHVDTAAWWWFCRNFPGHRR